MASNVEARKKAEKVSIDSMISRNGQVDAASLRGSSRETQVPSTALIFNVDS